MLKISSVVTCGFNPNDNVEIRSSCIGSSDKKLHRAFSSTQFGNVNETITRKDVLVQERCHIVMPLHIAIVYADVPNGISNFTPNKTKS